jgi:hypothetical protein
MSNPSLEKLETDVEAARAKLAVDLATLRSPNTYEEFAGGLKHEALGAKDVLIEKAMAGVQSKIEDIIEDLKAKAAANPTAALAIGAGIAWKLIRSPPIASGLVGAGLLSLLRTKAPEKMETDEAYLEHAKRRLREQASEFGENVKDEAAVMGLAVKEKASELGYVAKEHLEQWGAQAQDAAQRGLTGVADKTASLAGQVSSAIRDGAQSASKTATQAMSGAGTSLYDSVPRWQETLPGERARDNFLLGAASAAVLAAVCVAAQRRQGGE